jgi:2,3-bisphosphoglycerate-independent phosphoglycerate mutase
MDGVGVAPQSPANAVTLAKTPNLDSLWPRYPHTYLYAAGINVGLPHGVDGNSEVGHMNMGAGKIIFQELPRIDNPINSGNFF